MTRWTPEEDTRLRQLWAEGHAASAIAGMMQRGGRNTVIGRAHRLKLPARPERGNTPTANSISIADQRKKNVRGGTPRTVVKKTAAKPIQDRPALPRRTVEAGTDATPPASVPEPRMLSVQQLTAGDCKWPIGDPRDPSFGFCGHPRIVGCPYCPAHREVAFTSRFEAVAA